MAVNITLLVTAIKATLISRVKKWVQFDTIAARASGDGPGHWRIYIVVEALLYWHTQGQSKQSEDRISSVVDTRAVCQGQNAVTKADNCIRMRHLQSNMKFSTCHINTCEKQIKIPLGMIPTPFSPLPSTLSTWFWSLGADRGTGSRAGSLQVLVEHSLLCASTAGAENIRANNTKETSGYQPPAAPQYVGGGYNKKRTCTQMSS